MTGESKLEENRIGGRGGKEKLGKNFDFDNAALYGKVLA
jgi:hypothetical protein